MDLRAWRCGLTATALAISLLLLPTSCGKPGVEAARENRSALTNQQIVKLEDHDFLIAAEKALVRQKALAYTAVQNSKNLDVRKFARHIMESRDQALAEARDVMKAVGMKPTPYLLDEVRTEARNRLEHATGPTFDHKFLSLFTADQQEVIREYDSASYTAPNSDIRTYAARVMPVLRRDLATSLDLQKRLPANRS